MKIRTDFVTNSSSSSFVIAKHNLDADQIEAIHRHVEMMAKLGLVSDEAEAYPNAWEITESSHFISGYTFMDNLCISDLFNKIDIPDRVVFWDDREPNLVELEQTIKERPVKLEGQDWRQILHQDD